MIYGDTFDEIWQLQHENVIKECKVHRSFALFPVRLVDGRRVWLQYYYWLPIITKYSHNRAYIVHVNCGDSVPRYVTEEEARKSAMYQRWISYGWAK